MIKLSLKKHDFYILIPNIAGETYISSDWSRMRWMVAGIATEQKILELFEKSNDRNWNSFLAETIINDKEIISNLNSNKLSFLKLYYLWRLGLDLHTSKLLSNRLEDIINEILVDNWFHYQNDLIEQSIFNEFILRHKKDSTPNLQEQHNEIVAKIQAAQFATYVHPPANVREAILLILDHLHWLLVERFEPFVNFDQDVTLASIWLGHEFNEFLKTGKPHNLRKIDAVPSNSVA